MHICMQSANLLLGLHYKFNNIMFTRTNTFKCKMKITGPTYESQINLYNISIQRVKLYTYIFSIWLGTILENHCIYIIPGESEKIWQHTGITVDNRVRDYRRTSRVFSLLYI